MFAETFFVCSKRPINLLIYDSRTQVWMAEPFSVRFWHWKFGAGQVYVSTREACNETG